MRSLTLCVIVAVLSLTTSGNLTTNGLAQSIVVESISADPITDWNDPNFWETIDGRPVESSWQFADDEIRLAWYGLTEDEGVAILADGRAAEELFSLRILIPNPTDTDDCRFRLCLHIVVNRSVIHSWSHDRHVPHRTTR